VLTRDRPAAAHRAVESLLAGDPVPHVVLLDNHSSAEAATELRERWADVEGVDLLRSDRNLGCGGGRQHVIDRSEGELVLLLDDDAVLHAGALEILRRDLEAHPGAVAVTATVQRPDGVICHSGGTLHIAGGVAEFGLVGGMQPAGDPLPPSGLAGWVPGTAALIRRSALERFPLDAGMRAYYEDNEWCWRVSSALAQPFRRSVEARATHFITTRHPPGLDFSSRSRAIRLLNAHAHFYRRHGLLLNGGLFALVPELVDAHGERDIPGARLVMELLAARGPDWTFAEWMNGGLAPALGGARRLSDARRAVAARDDELARARADVERLTDEVAVQGAAATEHARVRTDQAALIEHLAARNATLERIEQGGWWRLRTRLLPLLRLLAALRRMAGR
jgi:GT2 family glycosyltransferase